jgi:Uncharacterized protein with SCP/PR1 domains
MNNVTLRGDKYPPLLFNILVCSFLLKLKFAPQHAKRYNDRMRKTLLVLISLFLAFIISFSPREIRAKSVTIPNLSTASELIDAVNALRASYGLSSYISNSILMRIAQKQAEYMASSGVANNHYSADGLLPYQRALQAGYAVKGDLSRGGFFAENITAGVGMTAEEAVKQWTQDDPHLNTMISTNLQDIGAGVAVSGNTFYYVIDCGLSTGGTPVAFTPPPSYNPTKSIMVMNTPNADGSLTYTVQSGDTLLGIAIAYNISLDDLFALNGLTAKSLIYSGQKLIIRAAYTPTPTYPPLTPTGIPTITSWPTSTPTSTKTLFPPTSTPSPGLPIPAARRAAIMIIITALSLSALLAFIGIKRK